MDSFSRREGLVFTSELSRMLPLVQVSDLTRTYHVGATEVTALDRPTSGALGSIQSGDLQSGARSAPNENLFTT